VSCALHICCTCSAKISLFFPAHTLRVVSLSSWMFQSPYTIVTTPPCHKIILLKRLFLGSCFRRLDDAFVLLVSLMFISNRKVSFLSDNCLDCRMNSVWWILLVTMLSGLRSQTRFLIRHGWLEIMALSFVLFHWDCFQFVLPFPWVALCCMCV